ncbi:MAG: hypothetical protein K6E29_05115 [Cyanobacteria bacterium RUI128]|nr:hypothetical protein [Cyanobacteria bacterium RUI128]
MKVDHNNKRKVGRPSLPTLTAVKGYKHSSVNLSQSLARKYDVKEGAKVALHIDDKDNMYMCFNACTGANIRTKKNGCKGSFTLSYTFSSSEICNILLSRANESKKAVYLVSAKCVLIEDKPYYLIIDKPIVI